MGRNCKLTILVLVVVLTVLTACNNEPYSSVYEETQMKMGTVMTIKAYGVNAKKAVEEAFKRIDEIEMLTSLNIPGSEVNKINEVSGVEYVSVHPDVYNIIKKSIEYSKLSKGAYDITVGPVVKLWNFGTEGARIPSPQEISNAISLVGYEKIKLDESNRSVMLQKKGMMIDLGGVAKGYAADEVLDVLIRNGVDRALINLGGSTIYTLGTKPGEELWSVGIQHPRQNNGGGFLGVLMASDKAISTSGDYQRFFMSDERRYHHILDPSTGYPAESGIMSGTVVLDRSKIEYPSMMGDALSTAVFVLGSSEGMKLIEGIDGAECLIALSDFSLITSQGIKDNIKSISEEFKYDAQGR